MAASFPLLQKRLFETGVWEAVRNHAGVTYLVGGAVRDSLANRVSRDLDLVVTGDFDSFKKTLLARAKAAFFLKENLDQHRLVIDSERGDIKVDIGPLKGTIIDDLNHRDLTCNAVAIDLTTWVKTGALSTIDPFGGVKDFENRQARILSPEVIEDDPLRLVRICRLAAEFELEVVPSTIETARTLAHLVITVSPERIRDELVKMAAGKNLSSGIILMESISLAKVLFPEIESMAATPQDGYHHTTVWEHSKETLRALESIDRKDWRLFDRLSPRVAESMGTDLVPGRPARWIAALAALFHDVGKTDTTRRGKDQILHFYGHPQKGVELVFSFRKRLALSHRETDALAVLIRNHLRCALLFQTGKPTSRAVYRLLRDAGFDLPLLIALAWADFTASRGPLSKKVDAEGYKRFLSQILETFFFPKVLSPPPLPVTGKNLMEKLNLPPGPHLGKIKEALEEEAFLGNRLSRAAAVKKAGVVVGVSQWRRIRGIVFDFDNTLAPTFPDLLAAFNTILERYGLRPLSTEELISRFGPPEEEFIRRLVPSQSVQKAINLYRDLHREHLKKAACYPGVKEVLRTAGDLGLSLGLVTGRGRRYLNDFFEALGMGNEFGATVAGDEVKAVKPDPEGLMKVLASLGLNPEETAFLGDSPADMSMAEKVGALPLGAFWDSAYRGDLVRGPARILFLSPDDFMMWLREGLAPRLRLKP